MKFINSLNKYFDLEQKIYSYFGYQEDWTKIPLSDYTENYWFIIDERCYWSPDVFSFENIEIGNSLYSGAIYKNKQSVWRVPEYSLVSVDTNTDGNKFLMVFDNIKECRDKKMIDLCNQTW